MADYGISTMIKVSVVDDDPYARTGLAGQIAKKPDEFAVIGLFASVEKFLANQAAKATDVVVLDVIIGAGNHLSANVEAIISAGHRVLAVTCDTDRTEIIAFLRRHTVNILNKSDLTDEKLHAAIRLTHVDATVMDRVVQNRLRELHLAAPELTPRQQEVFARIAAGVPAKAAARQLGMGEKTLYEHVQEIRRRYRDAGQPVEDLLTMHYKAIELGYIADPRDAE